MSNKPCKTCPFLVENWGKPNPNGFTKEEAEARNEEKNYHDWYTPENLKRLWGGTKEAEILICHSTDPGARDYGGWEIKPGVEQICLGQAVLAFQEIKLAEACNYDLREYRRRSNSPMRREVLHAWAMRFALGRTDLFGGLPIPTHIDASVFDSTAIPTTKNLKKHVNKNS